MRTKYLFAGVTALLLVSIVSAQQATTTLASGEKARLEQNKELVRQMYKIWPVGDKEALRKIVAEDYIQHEPSFETGLAPILKYFDALHASGKAGGPTARIVRMVAEGDLVVAHAERDGPNGHTAAMDIFRIANGKIAEHWGVAAPVPTITPKNNNGIF